MKKHEKIELNLNKMNSFNQHCFISHSVYNNVNHNRRVEKYTYIYIIKWNKHTR